MLVNVIHPTAECCERCKAEDSGFLLEDVTGTQRVFCFACYVALLRASLSLLKDTGRRA